MRRLTWSTLNALGANADRLALPAYRPGDVGIGVVHIGVGNFHRAHQAPCFETALNAGDLRWGVCGVNMQRGLLRDALAPQQGLYALDTGEARLQVIGCLRETRVASDGAASEAIGARMADPRVHWWTLTITEKGYCREDRHPGLAVDLQATQPPKTAPGLLYAALVKRFGEQANTGNGAGLPRAADIRAQATGLTIASCDNLARNGRSLRRVLKAFAEAARHEPGWRARAGRLVGDRGPIDAIDLLPDLIGEQIAFPDSMVDRIVPATTGALKESVAARLGLADAWPVATEPFTQWVIEDTVRGARPALERSGVQWVDDVAPYEALKLRLLNAAHSVLAYAGLLAGHRTVDQAFADPVISAFVERFWREAVVPMLPAAAQVAAPSYCARLRERFSNPTIGHALAQIANDGSLKIPLRWLGTDRALDAPGTTLDTALACWIRWLGVTPVDSILDPQGPRLAAAARDPDPRAAARGVLSILDAQAPEDRIVRIVDGLRDTGLALATLAARQPLARDRTR